MKLETPITSHELKQLEYFLIEKNALTLTEFYGFTLALVSAPIFLPPCFWLAELLGHEQLFDCEEHADAIINTISRLEYQAKKDLKENNLFYLSSLNLVDMTADEIAGELALWAQGYLDGCQLDESFWFSEKYGVVDAHLDYIKSLAMDEDKHILELRSTQDLSEDAFAAIKERLILGIRQVYCVAREQVME